MRTVDEIIRAFGGVPAFCAFFKVERQTAHTWRRRNFLPPDRDVDLVQEADRRKIRLTYEDLARMRASRDAA